MTLNSTKVTFRLGQPVDLAEVTRITREVWGGTDYMPAVWNNWLEQADSRVWVAEIEGEMGGFYSLKLIPGLEKRSGWWQGVRVAPAFTRQGLAGIMASHAVEQCRREKLPVLRYATGAENRAMHRLAKNQGFDFISRYSYISAPPLLEARDEVNDEKNQWVVSHPALEDLEKVRQFIQSAPAWHSGKGLYCEAYTWKDLENEVINRYLANNWFFGAYRQGQLEALALTFQDHSKQDRWAFVSWMDGSREAIVPLARAIQAFGTNLSPHETEVAISFMLVKEPERDRIMQSLGFLVDPQDEMLVFEKQV